MQCKPLALALAATLPSLALRAQYAGSVVSYTTGTGVNTGYTDPNSALGEPSRVTPGQFGGPVDPFNSAYLGSQLVGLGTGGALTVHFDAPVKDSPQNPFGMDFQVFGNSFFVVTNATDANFNYIGTPATDGSVFGADSATTRVSVSKDGQTFFTLTPSLAPILKNLFPTDGSGSFTVPVDPSLKGADFAGLTLDQIRAKYMGSGGGTGFDLAWARDAQNNPVTLDEINFVRVEVLSGTVQIDGFSVVPEPGTWALLGLGLGAVTVSRRRR
ncbi:MAG TPA: PEP-CTERM sorting domain-containing protein [Candidatus Limnocylindria bacterium]|jgi:hypothetical protein|nr:PEP-CTERM sorting domain-containing protein [Candidatus Limnocylindria bacterium]